MLSSLAIYFGFSLLCCALSQDVTLEIDNLGLHAPRKPFINVFKDVPYKPIVFPSGGVTDSTILGRDTDSGQVNQLFFETDPGLLSGMAVFRSLVYFDLRFDFDS